MDEWSSQWQRHRIMEWWHQILRGFHQWKQKWVWKTYIRRWWLIIYRLFQIELILRLRKINLTRWNIHRHLQKRKNGGKGKVCFQWWIRLWWRVQEQPKARFRQILKRWQSLLRSLAKRFKTRLRRAHKRVRTCGQRILGQRARLLPMNMWTRTENDCFFGIFSILWYLSIRESMF